MFSNEKHIFRAALLEQVSPLCWFKEFCLKEFVEIAIGKILAVVSFLEVDTRRVAVHQAAVIPFGVAFVSGERWDGIHSPVNEDSEFSVGEPLRISALI